MTKPNRPRKPWRRLRNIVLAIFIMIMMVAGWFALDLWRVYTDSPGSTDAARAEMLALCAADQPEGENGWFLLAEILERIDEVQRRTEGTLGEDNDWDRVAEAVRAAIATAIDERGLLDELRQVLSMPRFVRPWTSEGWLYNELLPLLHPARRLGEVLDHRMAEAAERENWDEMIDLLHLSIRLGDVTARQPTVLHGLVGAVIQRNALQTIRRLLIERDIPAETAASIAALVARIDDPDVIRNLEYARLETHATLHWLHGTRGYALPLSTIFDSGVTTDGLTFMGVVDPINDDRSLQRAYLSRWFLAPRDECAALADQFFDAMQAQAAQPFPTREDHGPSAALVAELQDLRRTILATFLQDLRTLPDQRDALIVERRATLLIAAIEQYEAFHAALPASLEDLVPEWIESVPTDPISGMPFGYRVVTDDSSVRGHVLYSFGPDGTDDGGIFDEDDSRTESYRVSRGVDIPLHD